MVVTLFQPQCAKVVVLQLVPWYHQCSAINVMRISELPMPYWNCPSIETGIYSFWRLYWKWQFAVVKFLVTNLRLGYGASRRKPKLPRDKVLVITVCYLKWKLSINLWFIVFIIMFNLYIINTLGLRQNGRHFPGRRHFLMHFLEWKCRNFDWDVMEVCSQGSN